MPYSQNNITLGGYLTRDPEISYTTAGKSVASCTVAVNSDSPNGPASPLYMDCEAWEKKAETLHRHLHKGDPVCFEGSLRFKEWEGRDGGKRTKYYLAISRIIFIPNPRAQQTSTAAPAPYPAQSYPSQPPQPSHRPEPGSPPPEDTPSDDLPF